MSSGPATTSATPYPAKSAENSVAVAHETSLSAWESSAAWPGVHHSDFGATPPHTPLSQRPHERHQASLRTQMARTPGVEASQAGWTTDRTRTGPLSTRYTLTSPNAKERDRMTNQSNPRRPELSVWPAIDRHYGHLRTPFGTVVPFAVIRTFSAVVAALIGVEVTFGLTNWITIPAFLIAACWAGLEIEEATIRYDHRPKPDAPDGDDI